MASQAGIGILNRPAPQPGVHNSTVKRKCQTMNQPFKLTFLLIALMTWQASAQEKSDFLPIFNGKDLHGWDAKPDCWEVRDGEIWCTGKAQKKNWLIYREKQPSNFEIRLEFRWDNVNTGVQVRSDDLGDWQVCGYQIEVATREKMGLWHHSLLDGKHPKKKTRHLMATAGQHVSIATDGTKSVQQVEAPEKIKEHFNDHEWNTLEVIAKGDTLIQKINGVTFSTITDSDAEMSRKKGWIAFQDHGKGCIAAFRKIQLRILPNQLLPDTTRFRATHTIQSDSVYYATGPQQASPPDGKFKAGTTVELLKKSGSYSLVCNQQGESGYVSTASLREIPERAFKRSRQKTEANK